MPTFQAQTNMFWYITMMMRDGDAHCFGLLETAVAEHTVV